MKAIAAGRIAFWEGGSLWVFDVPVGPEAPSRTDLHAHHAFQLTFSIGGDFNLYLEDRIVSGPYAVVASDAPHAFEAAGRVAHLFVEPESRAGRSLTKLMEGQPAAPISAEQARDAPELIKHAFDIRPTPEARCARSAFRSAAASPGIRAPSSLIAACARS